jgi:hypothetical protein
MAVDRYHASPGQTVRLTARFKFAGSVFDPNEVRQVQILDQNLAVITTLTTIVHDATGLFHVDWFIPTTETPSIHYDRWFATAQSGGSEEQFTFTFQVLTASADASTTPYVDMATMRLAIPEASNITDPELLELTLLGQETFEWITGQSFLPRSATRIFDGSGKAFLSIRRPVQTITAVSFLNCGGPDTDVDPSGIRILRSRTMLALGNAKRFSHRLYNWGGYWPCNVGGCGVWPGGVQNISITGEWGAFPTVPRQIQRALIQLVRYTAACDDPLGLPSAAFASESLAGDRSYTMRQVYTNAMTHNSTGYPDIDAVLSRFNTPITVGVV